MSPGRGRKFLLYGRRDSRTGKRPRVGAVDVRAQCHPVAGCHGDILFDKHAILRRAVLRHIITHLVSDNFGSGKSTFPDPVRSSVSLWGLPAIQSCPKHLCRPHFPESRTKGAIPGYDLARVSKPIGGQAGIFRRSSVAGTRIRPSRRFYSPAFLSWQGSYMAEGGRLWSASPGAGEKDRTGPGDASRSHFSQ